LPSSSQLLKPPSKLLKLSTQPAPLIPSMQMSLQTLSNHAHHSLHVKITLAAWKKMKFAVPSSKQVILLLDLMDLPCVFKEVK